MTGLEEFLSGTIRLSAPLILAALGEIVSQRSGVINISIEGMMLGGAFAGFAAGAVTGSAGAGLLAAAAAGALLGCVFAFLCVVRNADQIVAGMGINIVMIGLTGALFRAIFGMESLATAPRLEDYPIPVLSGLPVVGKVFFDQSVLVYACGALALGIWLFLRSPQGLGLRACGVRPEAADAAGVRVGLTRFAAVVFGGTMAGIAGAYLTLAQTSSFAENMTSGRGFIALAVVIFGRWHPIGAVLAALIFGGANEAQFWFQARGSQAMIAGVQVHIPYQALLALPYVVTLAVLTVFAGSYRGPRALGKPYVRSR